MDILTEINDEVGFKHSPLLARLITLTPDSFESRVLHCAICFQFYLVSKNMLKKNPNDETAFNLSNEMMTQIKDTWAKIDTCA